MKHAEEAALAWVLSRQLLGDGALLDRSSHWDTDFMSGRRFPRTFATPVEFEIDLDSEGRSMPPFFRVPAFVARTSFYELLRGCGVDNIEAYPAIIRNLETNERFDEYLVLNVIGLVSCADLGANPGVELGPGIRVLDSPVIVGSAMHGQLMFLLAEDPMQLIVADRVAARIREAGLDEVHLEPLVTV